MIVIAINYISVNLRVARELSLNPDTDYLCFFECILRSELEIRYGSSNGGSSYIYGWSHFLHIRRLKS